MNKNEEIKIRRGRKEDANELTQMGYQCFYNTFYHHPLNNPSDVDNYLSSAFNLQTIENDFEDPNVIYLIAELITNNNNENNNEIQENQIENVIKVGYVKLQLKSQEECIKNVLNPIELCRIYTITNYIGKGIGAKMMKEVLKISRELKADLIWLGVWEFNEQAVKFYKRFGFDRCGEHVFNLGSDPQTDWIFSLPLI